MLAAPVATNRRPALSPKGAPLRRNCWSCSGDWMRLAGATKRCEPKSCAACGGRRGCACGTAASTGLPVIAGPLAAAQGARVSSPRLTGGSGKAAAAAAPRRPAAGIARGGCPSFLAHGAAVGSMGARGEGCAGGSGSQAGGKGCREIQRLAGSNGEPSGLGFGGLQAAWVRLAPCSCRRCCGPVGRCSARLPITYFRRSLCRGTDRRTDRRCTLCSRCPLPPRLPRQPPPSPPSSTRLGRQPSTRCTSCPGAWRPL